MGLASQMDANQQGAMGNLQNIQSGALAQFQPAMMGQQMAGAYGQTDWRPDSAGQQHGRRISASTSRRARTWGSQREQRWHGHEPRGQRQAPGSERQQAAAQAAAGTSSRLASASQDKEIVMGGRSKSKSSARQR